MVFQILDTEFQTKKILDTFISAIWTERYSEYGDFEFHIALGAYDKDVYKEGYYVYNPKSKYLMIIEAVKTNIDVEEGSEFVITGRSLESILDRRIVWTQTIFENKSIHDVVKQLLNENAISPSVAARAIPGLIFEDSTAGTAKINAQFTGDNLYDAVKAVCDVDDIGFRIFLDEDTDEFVFSIYSGLDRSRDQDVRDYVEFSPEFDNIINSEYAEDISGVKTITLVAGEGEGVDRRTTTVEASGGAGSGLARRELFTDARDISSTIEGGTLSNADYIAELQQRGKEDLAEHTISKVFECETPKSNEFVYGEDYGLGDIVQYRNEYGIEAHARVIEYIMSHDATGEQAYPGFVVVD